MSRSRRLILLALVMSLLSVAATAELSVRPSVVNYDRGEAEFKVTVTNDGSEAETAWILFEQTSGSDPLTVEGEPESISPADFTATVKERGGERNAIRLSNGTLGSGETLSLNVTLDMASTGSRVVEANLSNGKEMTVSDLYIDDAPPEVINRTPTAANITDPAPTIAADLTDGQGIGVAVDRIEARLNGVSVPVDWFSVRNEDRVTVSPPAANVTEGVNNVSLRLVDQFGNSDWYNWSFTLAIKPIVAGGEPRGLVQEDGPTIRVSLEDPSGIDFEQTWIGIDGDRFRRSNAAFTVDELENGTSYIASVQDPDFLPDGAHNIRVKAVDGKGNSRTASWNFTTDVTDPEISSISVSGGEEIYKGTMGVFVEASDATAGIDRVVFEADGQQDIVRERTGSEDQFRGAIDTTELFDGDQELNITVIDAAGNRVWEQRGFIVDNEAPAIVYSEIFPDPTNSPPTLTVRAEDDGTKATMAEYFIGTDPGKGDAHEMTLLREEGQVTAFRTTVNTSGLENGNHSVFVRVKDLAQHWSDPAELMFAFNRSLQADIRFSTIRPIFVTQSETGSGTVLITNTGKVPVRVNLTARSELAVHASPAARNIQPGSRKAFDLTVDIPDNQPIGNYSVTVVATAGEARMRNRTIVAVNPDEAQIETIRESWQNISRRVQGLRERNQQWRRQLDRDVTVNISESLAAIEERLWLVNGTRYDDINYRQLARLSPIVRDRLDRIEATLDERIEEQRQQTRRRNVVLATIALLIVIGVTAAYRMMPPPEGYSEGGFIHRPEGKHPARARGEEMVAKLREKAQQRFDDIVEYIESRDMDEQAVRDEEGWTGYEPEE